MPDYDFYVNHYYGMDIPEKAFSGMVNRAMGVLRRFRSIYRVADTSEAEEKMALCAMAETLYRYARRGLLKSSRTGSVSVAYEERKALAAALYESAGIYLDIHRGVGA